MKLKQSRLKIKSILLIMVLTITLSIAQLRCASSNTAIPKKEVGQNDFSPLEKPADCVDHKPALVALVSHYAKYNIRLDKKSFYDEGISDVNGSLEITLIDLGNKWHYIEKTILFVYFKDKKKADRHVSTFESTESKDSLLYEFVHTKATNAHQDESVIKGRIRATAGSKREVVYEMPLGEVRELPSCAVFPIQHMIDFVRNAQRNQFTLSSPFVFDGSSETQEVMSVDTEMTPYPAYQLNTTLTLPYGDAQKGDSSISLSENIFVEKLKQARVWKCKMSVYPAGKRESAEPDYQYTQVLNEMGMMLSSKIKYMDPEFTVDITLTDCKEVHQGFTSAPEI